jgi:Fe-Mn family superoxide dismutase
MKPTKELMGRRSLVLGSASVTIAALYATRAAKADPPKLEDKAELPSSVTSSINEFSSEKFPASVAPAVTLDLPPLKYGYDSLSAVINEETMKLHHDVHHAGYLDKLKNALKNADEIFRLAPLVSLLSSINKIPEALKTQVGNQGGGHYNHCLFWESMSPKGIKFPTGKLAQSIDTTFGSFTDFQKAFENAGVSHFGSGWVWLVINQKKQLSIITTANQDTPLAKGYVPLLGNDLWEHAYYLMYRNRRAEYLSKWWSIVDWQVVETRFLKTFIGQ